MHFDWACQCRPRPRLPVAAGSRRRLLLVAAGGLALAVLCPRAVAAEAAGEEPPLLEEEGGPVRAAPRGGACLMQSSLARVRRGRLVEGERDGEAATSLGGGGAAGAVAAAEVGLSSFVAVDSFAATDPDAHWALGSAQVALASTADGTKAALRASPAVLEAGVLTAFSPSFLVRGFRLGPRCGLHGGDRRELALLALGATSGASKMVLAWLLVPMVILLALMIPFFLPASLQRSMLGQRGAAAIGGKPAAQEVTAPSGPGSRPPSTTAVRAAPPQRRPSKDFAAQAPPRPSLLQVQRPSLNATSPAGHSAVGRASDTSRLSEVNWNKGEVLCSDLVVPRDWECSLFVPIRPLMSNMGPVIIKDMNGGPVVRIVAQEFLGRLTSAASCGDAPNFGNRNQSLQLLLQTPQGENLAHCQTTSHEEFAIYHSHGEYFAKLSPTGPHCTATEPYQLVTHGGTKLNFWGKIEEHQISITDAKGMLLGTTYRCVVDFHREGNYFCMRMAPGVDVGLMVSCLLCIQILARTHE